VKFNDTFRSSLPRAAQQPGSQDIRFERLPPMKAQAGPAAAGPEPKIAGASDSAKPLAVKEINTGHSRRRVSHSDRDLHTFQDRLRMGKVKLCDVCGGVMVKSSRMILSALAGLALIVLGAILMGLYGFATNFYQPPWFVRFLLPAGYYVGSIMVGIGIIFFFIREKIWYCPKCSEIRRR